MRTIVWYRNDLRTIDHHPLTEAAKSGDVVGIYIFDPRDYKNTAHGFPKTDAIFMQFLNESVTYLRAKLRAISASGT